MKYKAAGSLFLSLFLLAGANIVVAEESTAGQQAPAEETKGPAQALEEGMGKMLAFLQQEQEPEQQALEEFLSSEIAPFFDFPMVIN